MTPTRFRRLALSLPDAVEGQHGGHPDFRIGGKVFASLGFPDKAFGVVKLTPDQQAMLAATTPDVFAPVRGGWGERGYTKVRLAAVDAETLKHALTLAHQNCAPKKKRTAGTADASGRATARVTARVRKAIKASRLPGIEDGTSYGYPSMKVRGKFLMRIKDAETLVFTCPLDEKAMLMEAAPEIYFETDHYAGWPAVLARTSAISDAELVHRIERAWRVQAPKRLVAEHDGPATAKSKSKKK
jgi:hypothetical protein